MKETLKEKFAQANPWRLLWLLFLALLTLVYVLNVSRPGRVESCLHGCAQARQKDAEELRVISFNVLHGFPRFHNLTPRLDLIAAEIQHVDADIIILQEVPWNIFLRSGAHYLAEKAGMNYVARSANGNRWTILFSEGEAILSRYPLKDVRSVELQPQAGFFEHRIALEATVETQQGDVRAVGTHLSSDNKQANRIQADALVQFVQAGTDLPVFIGGDFNALEGSPQIRRLSQQWVDTYREVHMADPGYTCCVDDLSTRSYAHFMKRIDYLFLAQGASSSLQILDSQVIFNHPFSLPGGGWQWASDHAGVMTSVSRSSNLVNGKLK